MRPIGVSRRSVLRLSLMLPMASLARTAAAEDFVEGTHYERVEPPQPTQSGERIEVLELFWYGCPHCFEFEPFIADWLEQKPEDVAFRRMPAVFAPNWRPAAKAFYAEEILGLGAETHAALFNAIHVEKRRLVDEPSLTRFFVEQGVTEERFRDAYNSFENDTKVRQAEVLSRAYAITGVPALVVNGKYRASAGQATSYEELLKLADFLVDKERKAMAGQS